MNNKINYDTLQNEPTLTLVLLYKNKIGTFICTNTKVIYCLKFYNSELAFILEFTIDDIRFDVFIETTELLVNKNTTKNTIYINSWSELNINGICYNDKNARLYLCSTPKDAMEIIRQYILLHTHNRTEHDKKIIYGMYKRTMEKLKHKTRFEIISQTIKPKYTI